jgi:hypothetical protein
MQGHKVFVGAIEHWGAGLPGVTEERGKKSGSAGTSQGSVTGSAAEERMKIAWRYERLGTVGAENERRGALEINHVIYLIEQSAVQLEAHSSRPEYRSAKDICRFTAERRGRVINSILSYIRSYNTTKTSVFKPTN